MERAARLIKTNQYSRQILTDEDLVRGLWASAVGRAIARHTCKLKIVRKTLIVDVEDAIWQRQLVPLSGQIVSRIQKMMGASSIEKVEFRVGIPKREMQREENARLPEGGIQSGSEDEADQILDPVLKKLYRISRKKASA